MLELNTFRLTPSLKVTIFTFYHLLCSWLFFIIIFFVWFSFHRWLAVIIMSLCIIRHKTSSQLILTRPYIHGVSQNQSIQTSVSSYSRNHYLLVWVIASTGGQLPGWPMRIITKQQPSQTDAFKLSSRKNENFLHRRQAIQYPPANDRSLPAPDQTGAGS